LRGLRVSGSGSGSASAFARGDGDDEGSIAHDRRALSHARASAAVVVRVEASARGFESRLAPPPAPTPVARLTTHPVVATPRNALGRFTTHATIAKHRIAARFVSGRDDRGPRGPRGACRGDIVPIDRSIWRPRRGEWRNFAKCRSRIPSVGSAFIGQLIGPR
jgi:hypothetical protein